MIFDGSGESRRTTPMNLAARCARRCGGVDRRGGARGAHDSRAGGDRRPARTLIPGAANVIAGVVPRRLWMCGTPTTPFAARRQ